MTFVFCSTFLYIPSHSFDDSVVLALADKDLSSSMVFHRSDDLIIVSCTVNVT
jgi:hypothetical protein